MPIPSLLSRIADDPRLLLHRAVRLGAAATAGLLLFASFRFRCCWPLSFVALTPLLLATRDQSSTTAVILGATAGSLAGGLSLAWLVPSLSRFSGSSALMPLVVLALLAVWYGGRLALFAWLMARATHRRWPLLVVVPAAMGAVEFVYPLPFPWYIANALTPVPLLLQTADLAGPVLPGVPLSLAGAALALQFRRNLSVRQRVRIALAPAAVLLAVAGYGAARQWETRRQVHRSPAVTVGLVQPDLPVPLPRPVPADLLTSHLLRQTQRARERGAELVIWPETSYLSPLSTSLLEQPLSPLREVGVPVIIGALVRDDSSPERAWYNAALSVTRDGRITGMHAKNRLIPFAEHWPRVPGLSWLQRYFPRGFREAAGNAPVPLPFEHQRVGMLICYEDLFPDQVARTVATAHPHILVDMSNDGWFAGTAARRMHQDLALLRAVESRLFLIRVTNDGVTSVVSPTGEVLMQLPVDTRSEGVVQVRWMQANGLVSTLLPWWRGMALILGVMLIWLKWPWKTREQSEGTRGSMAGPAFP